MSQSPPIAVAGLARLSCDSSWWKTTNGMRTAVVLCKPDRIRPGLSRNNLRTLRMRAAFEQAVAAASAADPTRPFGAKDVTANLRAYPAKPRTELSMRRLLAAEARRPDGLVRRVGLGLYLAREEAERLELLATPRLRVQQAAVQLTAAGVRVFTVQQLLARVNQAAMPLSQRSVYYGVSQMLAGPAPSLVRVDWGRYTLSGDAERVAEPL